MEPENEPTALQAEFRRLWELSGWRFKNRAARELGISPSTVGRYLDHTIDPSLPVLRLFADRIGHPLELPGEAGKHRTLTDGPRWLEEWESDVITNLRRVPPDARKRVIRGINEIVDAVIRPVTYRRPQRPEGETGAAPAGSDYYAEQVVRSLGSQDPSTGERPGPTGAGPGRPPARPKGGEDEKAKKRSTS